LLLWNLKGFRTLGGKLAMNYKPYDSVMGIVGL
jgi:hypothetical protein